MVSHDEKDFVIHGDDETTEDSLVDQEDAYRKTDSAFQKNSMLPYALGGAGVIVAVIAIILALSGGEKTAGMEQLQALETRVLRLEEKLAGLESLEKQLALVETQQSELAKLAKRYDRFEATVNTQIDQIIKELGNLYQKTSARGKAAPRVSKAPEPISPTARFHRVKSGETLYRISRKYGLTVKQLQSYNQLAPGAAIYPGQKLRLTPPESLQKKSTP